MYLDRISHWVRFHGYLYRHFTFKFVSEQQYAVFTERERLEMLEETKQMPSKKADSDGLDSVSRVSVATPHSRSQCSDAVSYRSSVSQTTTQTTQSTRDKLALVEAELAAERAKRVDAEAKIKALIAKKSKE